MQAHYLILLAVVAGCSDSEQPVLVQFAASGYLEDDRIREASGLARSNRQPGVLWLHNDRGNENRVFAMDVSGTRLGTFKLAGVDNDDWEDLSSFQLDGVPYLMIGEIGDNEAVHAHRSLYFVEEPVPQVKGSAETAWQVDYVYPDGPRDAEAAVIDRDGRRVLVLSKRDIPQRLYSVPLHATNYVVEATLLGPINSLPVPSRNDIEFAPQTKDWWWQPVGMDIADDGRAAVIVTYRAIYYFQRGPEQSWYAALNSRPVAVSLGDFENAEAVAFADDARTVVVTGENMHSKILIVDMSGAVDQ